jgi:hypothetical protein
VPISSTVKQLNELMALLMLIDAEQRCNWTFAGVERRDEVMRAILNLGRREHDMHTRHSRARCAKIDRALPAITHARSH